MTTPGPSTSPLPWAQLISTKRAAHDLSQRKLAQKVGVQPSSVSMWESGRHAPGPEQIAQLIRVLEITPDEIHAIYATPAAPAT